MNAERRSSSRSIKRKRFDDEIVDYSLPSPLNRLSKQRTSSQATLNSSLEALNVSTSGPSSPISSPATTPAVDNLPAQKPSPPLAISTPPIPKTTPKVEPVPEASVVCPPVSVVVKSFTAPVATASHTIVSTAVSPSVPQTSSIKSEPLTTQSTLATAPIPTQSHYVPLNLPLATSMFADRKKSSSKSNNKKAAKNHRGLSVTSTKDLGRWKPVDDLALIIGVQQTNDLKMVHRGTKFSCKFTMTELQNRWYALLYEESVSRIAVAAMRNLHPELVENIQSKALYTTQEEELLATIKSTENPTLETFQELLQKNASIFYSSRTPKKLQSHWQLMKQYYLLPDQVLKVPGKDGAVLSFSDNEELLNDAELAEPRDEGLDAEMTLVDRRNKREIRQLENELGRWNVLVDSMTGMGFPPEFDRQTLAVLRGRLVRYLMRSREITIGRSTKDSTVDVDLCLEGPAIKVSRKQGTIKLRSNADFFLTNEGKRPIYVDGLAVLKGYKTRLSHNCAIEIAGLRFTFLVNFDLINAIQQESAKMNTPLT